MNIFFLLIGAAIGYLPGGPTGAAIGAIAGGVMSFFPPLAYGAMGVGVGGVAGALFTMALAAMSHHPERLDSLWIWIVGIGAIGGGVAGVAFGVSIMNIEDVDTQLREINKKLQDIGDRISGASGGDDE